MSRIVKVGLIQASCPWSPPKYSLKQIKEKMIAKHVDMVEQAAKKGVQMLGLQEIFYGPYFCAEQDAKWYDTAETIPGPTTTIMQKLAKKHKMVIVSPIYETPSTGQRVTDEGQPVYRLFEELEAYVAQRQARAFSSPFVIYHDEEFKEEGADLEVAVPIQDWIQGNERVAARQRSRRVVPVLGARSKKQLLDNLGCLEHPLDAELLSRLDQANPFSPGFPHDFLASEHVRSLIFGETFEKIE